MGRYYEIIPVTSKHSTIFDAIWNVAYATGLAYWKVLLMMGFESESDFVSYCNNQTTAFFSKAAFVTKKLNDICIACDAPLRVIRPQTMNIRKEHE